MPITPQEGSKRIHQRPVKLIMWRVIADVAAAPEESNIRTSPNASYGPRRPPVDGGGSGRVAWRGGYTEEVGGCQQVRYTHIRSEHREETTMG